MPNCPNPPGFTPRSRVSRMWSHCRTGFSSCGKQPGTMLMHILPITGRRDKEAKSPIIHLQNHPSSPLISTHRATVGSSNKSPQFLPYTTALLSSLTTIQTIRTEFKPPYRSSLVSTIFFTLDFRKTKNKTKSYR